MPSYFLMFTESMLAKCSQQLVQLRLYLLSPLFFLLTSNLSFGQSASRKPNVIIIYTDDQGSLDLNAYGATDLHTPHIDALMRDGIQFKQFYAASPVCSPSRAALLTGRYPQHAGLPGNASSTKGVAGMPTEQITLAEMFKSAGYTTAHIGKWHLGFTKETMPNGQGFDYSFGHMGGCIDNYSHFFYWDGPNRHDLWRNGVEIWEDGKYFPDLIVSETKQYFIQQRDQPFFLYLAFNLPHYPMQGEEKWRRYYAHLPEPRRQYAASVSTMDEKIGAIIQSLKKAGLYQNTIIIFQSDHGHSTEERAFGGGGFAGEYHGAKFSLLEGGIRVPASITWQAGLPKKKISSHFATNIDWMPTLAELCGIPLKDSVDGKSLASILHDKKTDSSNRVFFWQTDAKGRNQWCVRKGDWKLMHEPLGIDSTLLTDKKLFLSNPILNPAEDKNFASDQPEIVEELSHLYNEWVAREFR